MPWQQTGWWAEGLGFRVRGGRHTILGAPAAAAGSAVAASVAAASVAAMVAVPRPHLYAVPQGAALQEPPRPLALPRHAGCRSKECAMLQVSLARRAFCRANTLMALCSNAEDGCVGSDANISEGDAHLR